ncbi:MAG: type II toxin-antitoxin system RelE/ParE family toxin [Oscillospiraceae bacterium]|nr:type II toxin-antitoxin system RelE/ParE family toxin [Oscillospiraceae bacterium]
MGVMQQVYELSFYVTQSGRVPVKDFLRDLQKKNRQSDINAIRTYLDRLKEYGPEIDRYFPKSTRKLSKEGLWELRPGGNRVFFFYFSGNRIMLLHAYQKQSQKTPQAELEKAVREMKDCQRRAR